MCSLRLRVFTTTVLRRRRAARGERWNRWSSHAWPVSICPCQNTVRDDTRGRHGLWPSWSNPHPFSPSLQRRGVGYWRSGLTAILPPPKLWDTWYTFVTPILPLSLPFFAFVASIFFILPPPPDCRPGRSAPSGSLTTPLVVRASLYTSVYL